jgi:hypothetical protein
LTLAVAATTACDRKSPHEDPATRPATQPATTASEPAESVLTISNQAYRFHPARLIAEALPSGEPGVLVQVFSEGASLEGAQDGFYLEMTLDIPDVSQLDGATWQYTSTSNERADDMLSAITINDGASQLQPRDVVATFRTVSPGMVEVQLSGTFNLFGGRDASTATGTVPIEATLLAKRETPR